jgi:hypothetical protein
MTLTEELMAILNKHSREDASNTPDYVLAGFLMNVLQAFEEGIVCRDRFYEWNPKFSDRRKWGLGKQEEDS